MRVDYLAPTTTLSLAGKKNIMVQGEFVSISRAKYKVYISRYL